MFDRVRLRLALVRQLIDASVFVDINSLVLVDASDRSAMERLGFAVVGPADRKPLLRQSGRSASFFDDVVKSSLNSSVVFMVCYLGDIRCYGQFGLRWQSKKST